MTISKPFLDIILLVLNRNLQIFLATVINPIWQQRRYIASLVIIRNGVLRALLISNDFLKNF